MTPEITLDYQSILALRSHEETMRLHAQALGAHCECLAMNAENCAIMQLAPEAPIPHRDSDYWTVMKKWGLINDKGEPLI